MDFLIFCFFYVFLCFLFLSSFFAFIHLHFSPIAFQHSCSALTAVSVHSYKSSPPSLLVRRSVQCKADSMGVAASAVVEVVRVVRVGMEASGGGG